MQVNDESFSSVEVFFSCSAFSSMSIGGDGDGDEIGDGDESGHDGDRVVVEFGSGLPFSDARGDFILFIAVIVFIAFFGAMLYR